MGHLEVVLELKTEVVVAFVDDVLLQEVHPLREGLRVLTTEVPLIEVNPPLVPLPLPFQHLNLPLINLLTPPVVQIFPRHPRPPPVHLAHLTLPIHDRHLTFHSLWVTLVLELSQHPVLVLLGLAFRSVHFFLKDEGLVVAVGMLTFEGELV